MSYVLLILLLFILLYTYILYPLLLKNNAKGKQLKFMRYTVEDILPNVTILMPVRNEAGVIEEKLNSVLASDYPLDKISIIIGLDACTDATHSILKSKFNLQNIKVISFNERQGKPKIINQLMAQVSTYDELVIFTDANVLFSNSTIFELVSYFKDEKIGLVDAVILPKKITNLNEKDYWNYETEIKHHESLVYGIIPGPSGGCFAIRKALFTTIPDNFLVDDFFIGFSIVIQQSNTILNSKAICYEDVITNWKQEFERKKRIATGNFQNLWRFKTYAFKIWSPIGKLFLSHKVLRWKTPFFLLIIYYILLFKFTLFILIVTLFLPVIDGILSIFGVEFWPLRRFSYFIVMNIAVLLGFINFCKGVKSNVWQPTKRT